MRDRAGAAALRRHHEQILLRVSREVIKDSADYVVDPPATGTTEARIRFVGRVNPDRCAGLILDAEWLEAVFFLSRNVSILKLDAYDNDEFATVQARQLLTVVDAFLRGEGSIETRRTFSGRRRPVLRLHVDGQAWVAT